MGEISGTPVFASVSQGIEYNLQSEPGAKYSALWASCSLFRIQVPFSVTFPSLSGGTQDLALA